MDDFRRRLMLVDPRRPDQVPAALAKEAQAFAAKVKNPVEVPWPAEWAPRADPAGTAPADSAPLPQRDVLVVTWTAGEARTLSQLFTGNNFENWYAYRHNVAAYLPKVTGGKAPFNDNGRGFERYYHTLGLYFPFRIGSITALAFKSGLHMAYDGPAVPIVDLWAQIIAEVKPRLVITTGTGGGIGADMLLGDVLVAGSARFDLTSTLKSEPFHGTSYPTSPIDERHVASLITPALLQPNGNLLDTPRAPRIVYPSASLSTVVSTDTFAFDETTDHFGLQQLGKCCDMGDATLGRAIQLLGASAPDWISIRNASDPQIKNSGPDGMAQATKEAEAIYDQYQMVTTAGSVVATWATIVASASLVATTTRRVQASKPARRKVLARVAAGVAARALRVPITNVYGGGDYTAAIQVGSQGAVANVILDTGSSTLAVTLKDYQPVHDKSLQGTTLAQDITYGTGGWAGPVVKTSLVLGPQGANVTLTGVSVAIALVQEPNNFGQADGILGLAYAALNNAADFSGSLPSSAKSTYPWPFKVASTKLGVVAFQAHLQGLPTVDVDPYFAQLAAQGVVPNKFAFYTLRSYPRVTSANESPASLAQDPWNRGVLVLGGGEEQTDLYTGTFAVVSVVDDLYYNVNLKSVAVGTRTPVPVAALQAKFSGQGSNAIVDTGTNSLVLAHDVYASILSAFEAINPSFAQIVRSAAQHNGAIAASSLHLSDWPSIKFVLQGPGGDVPLTLAPTTYWQLDVAPGQALCLLNGMPASPQTPNQSILGLPLMNNYYTVFDRSADANGVIRFAPIKAPVA